MDKTVTDAIVSSISAYGPTVAAIGAACIAIVVGVRAFSWIRSALK